MGQRIKRLWEVRTYPQWPSADSNSCRQRAAEVPEQGMRSGLLGLLCLISAALLMVLILRRGGGRGAPLHCPPRLSERTFLAGKGWSTTRNNVLVLKSGGQFGISSSGIHSLSALGGVAWPPGSGYGNQQCGG